MLAIRLHGRYGHSHGLAAFSSTDPRRATLTDVTDKVDHFRTIGFGKPGQPMRYYVVATP